MMVSPVAVVSTMAASVIAISFTPTDTLAVIAASAALVTAGGAVVVNIIVALRTTKKLEEVSGKADVIAGHVNSAAAASTAKIDGLLSEIGLLRAQLAERKETAAVLAQAVASKGST